MGLFGRTRRGGGSGDADASAAGERLRRELADYPPYVPPHPGDPRTLDAGAALDNLVHFERVLPERLRALAALLERWGIEVPPDLSAVEPEPLVAALHDWSGRSWTALEASESRWRSGARTGPADIAFSLAHDVSALLGELVRHGRGSWRWAVDLDPAHRLDGVETFHRVVLQAPFVPDPTRTVELDIERSVVDRLVHPEHADQRHGRPWWRAVSSALSGAQEGAVPLI